MTRRLAPLVALLALVAVTGCGGDDNGGGATATTPARTTATAGAYQRQVQAILASVGAAGSQLGAAARSSTSPSDLADALQRFQSAVRSAADRLGQTSAPGGAAAGQAELEAVLREIAAGVQPAIDAARRGDRAAFTARFRAYQRKLDGQYRQRLTAAGAKIDRALARQ
jgi:hypothetical protein